MNRSAGLAARFLAAQLLVVGAGAVTFAIIALAIGPALFRDHVRQALGVVSPVLERHLDDAFAAAAGIAIGVGTGAAIVTAAGVSLVVARRLSQSIESLANAAATVAAGNYTARVPGHGLGPEIDALAGSFNAMAGQLEATEATRRRLLADAAHELRTPLATLDAFIEGLADGIRAPAQETWDIMAAQTLRLRRLADDISLVSRAEEQQLPLDLRPVNIGQVAATAVSAARPGYDAKGVKLTSEIAADLAELAADRERIAQVLAELLFNALRHTPPGGEVTVRARSSGSAVQITVTDTGEGLAAEHLPHIFERFYRADAARDRNHGGSGIGLAIARALIMAHGGSITASSGGQGLGARVTITLPASVPPAGRPRLGNG
jgi:signal transduction histidine kinase